MDDHQLFHLSKSIEEQAEELSDAEFYQKPAIYTSLLLKAVSLMKELVRREIARNGINSEKS